MQQLPPLSTRMSRCAQGRIAAPAPDFWRSRASAGLIKGPADFFQSRYARRSKFSMMKLAQVRPGWALLLGRSAWIRAEGGQARDHRSADARQLSPRYPAFPHFVAVQNLRFDGPRLANTTELIYETRSTTRRGGQKWTRRMLASAVARVGPSHMSKP